MTGFDQSDWIDSAHDQEPEESPSDSARGKGQAERRSKADIALELVHPPAFCLFHTAQGEAFADIEPNGFRVSVPLRSADFARSLEFAFFRETGVGLGDHARDQVIATIEAQARFDSPEREVFLRVANLGDTIYLDLANEGRVVRIDGEGWCVVELPEVRFRTPSSMGALPIPMKGGDLDDLRALVGLDQDSFVLLIGWMLGALSGRGPYPIAVLQGEQGSGKSTLSRMAMALVDPSTVSLRSAPRDESTLMTAARHSYALNFDNLSHVPEWLSDALCRLATGTSFATRTLYTTAEEFSFRAARPIIVNGIPELCTRPDLADRAILIRLKPRAEFIKETDLWGRFEELRASILGALLHAVSGAIRHRHSRVLSNAPRMADFSNLIHAAEPALGWSDGTFERTYAVARLSLVETELELNPVAIAIRKLIENPELTAGRNSGIRAERGGLIGSASAWLNAINNTEPIARRYSNAWPQSPRSLSSALRRLSPALRQVGIEVDADAGSTKARAIYIVDSNASINQD